MYYVLYFVAVVRVPFHMQVAAEGPVRGKPPKTVAPSMSVYWLAGNHPRLDAQREKRRLYALSIVATHTI